MNPRKLISLMVMVTACAIWIYDITLIFRKKSIEGTKCEFIIERKLFEKYEYRTDFTDPFFCSQVMAKKQEKFVKSGLPTPSRKVSTILLPVCKIGGIIYTPGNPMAIFISGEKSQLVKQGDVIDSIKIVSIKPQVVEVSYREKKFTLIQ